MSSFPVVMRGSPSATAWIFRLFLSASPPFTLSPVSFWLLRGGRWFWWLCAALGSGSWCLSRCNSSSAAFPFPSPGACFPPFAPFLLSPPAARPRRLAPTSWSVFVFACPLSPCLVAPSLPSRTCFLPGLHAPAVLARQSPT